MVAGDIDYHWNPLQKRRPRDVVYGPFAGVIGTFVRYRGKGRVVVHIEALGQFAGLMRMRRRGAVTEILS